MDYISKLAAEIKPFFETECGKKYITTISSGEHDVLVNLDKFAEWNVHLSGIIINEATKYGIKAFEKALKEASEVSDIEVGFYGDCIPFVKVHEISSKHIGKMIRIRGLVNRTHFIKPMGVRIVFRCRECGIDSMPILQESPFALTLPFGKCESCKAPRPKYDIIEELSEYIDSQEFSIQEAYEDVSGRIPQRLRLIAYKKYLINKVYCGDLVEITGLIRLIPEYRKRSKSRFNTPYMEVHHIKKKSKDPESIEISKEEEEKIIELSKNPNIYAIFVRNVAPSLFGMENSKEACLLTLFGGVEKRKVDITIRGNIHIFIVGSPATGKSKLLRAVAELSPRGIYASGRGTTAAGLTASLNKDESGEWMIEAGVLVLGDKGVACMKGNANIFVGDDLINVKDLWNRGLPTQNPLKRKLFLYIPSWKRDGKLVPEILYEIIRKPYNGEILKIKLSNGQIFAVTPDHKFFVRTFDGIRIKEAKELKANDNNLIYPNLNEGFNGWNINEGKAYLYGMIYGDGYADRFKLRIHQAKKNADILSKVKDIVPFISKNYHFGKDQVDVKDKKLRLEYFNHFGKLQSILKLSKKSLSAFLAGLFDADGTYRIDYKSKSIWELKIYPTFNTFQIEKLFYAIRKLGIDCKILRFPSYKKKHILGIGVYGSDIDKFWEILKPYSIKLSRIEKKQSRRFRKKKLSIISINKKNHNGYVYDVNVRKKHNFIIGGIVSHNCIDEIDKMRKEDRVNIHEAMAGQTVCYSDDTEILTNEGWKLFKDLNKDELAVTLNLKTDEIEYQKPTKYHEYDYEGQMLKIADSRKVDFLVTPNHKLLISYYKHHDNYNRWSPFGLVTAERIFGKHVKFKRDGKWFGKEKKYFILPTIIKKLNQYKQITMPPLRIPMDLWLEFFGYWTAEGHVKPYYVNIAQSENTEKWKKIKSCLERLPFKYSYKGNNFIICNKQLASYLMRFGHSPQKYLPKEIKLLSSRQLKTLLDAMMLGDGNKQKTVYYTTSSHLADDIQELLLKVGLSGNIKNRKNKNHFSIIGGKRIVKPNCDELEVRFIRYNQPQIGYDSNKRKRSGKTEWINYKGKVYCVEVPNHIIYVRRNGKPVWSGNSIDKAGIHSTLMARTAVVAAANPTLGNYDRSKSVFENLSDFPPALFSRFDLIFILIDKPKDEFDRKVAEHIANNDEISETINRELFKKYIAYAKRINPIISKEAKELLMEHFLSIRKRMSETWTEETTPITFRQFEALIRLCEAHARILLKKEADVEDAKAVIKIFDKFLSDISFDIGTLEGGPHKSTKRYAVEMIRSIIVNKQTSDGIGHSAIVEEAVAKGISKRRAKEAINELINSSSIFLVGSDGTENYYRTSWF